jgi:CheY-like chemotaxis protein
MKPRILVATPTLGFGEMIRQTLEGTGALSVGVASGTDSAKQQATNDPYAMAILDSDLGLSELKNLAQHLRQTSPSLHLLIIPPEEEGLQREIETLEPDGFLSKPFYLPDLLETVQTLLGIDPAAGALPAPENGRVAEVSIRDGKTSELRSRWPSPLSKPPNHLDNPPIWFQDASQVRGVLAQLVPQTAAFTAFVLRYDQVWALTGEASEAQIQFLATTVAQHWPQGNGTDLARFVHLEDQDSDCMLYATSVGGEYVLTLAFDAETPFSTIRKQVNVLSRTLKRPPQFSGELDYPDSVTESSTP